MLTKLSLRIDALKRKLASEEARTHIQFICVFSLFILLSFVMSVVNLATGFNGLACITIAFSILNIINLLFSFSTEQLERLSHILFGIEIILLFTYFVVSGSPDGFSAIWVALLPSSGLLLYRRKVGSILTLIMFIILAFFFWTDIGQSLLLYDGYSATFLLRFPILYLAFYLIGFFFESVRSFTQSELTSLTERYRSMSYTDRLTGLGNETAYFRTLAKLERNIDKGTASFAIAVMDVNGVKATNDAHGHRYGCHLIVKAGKALPYIFPDSHLFHIGGDEFVAVIQGKDYQYLEDRIAEFNQALEYTSTNYEKTNLVLSVAIGYSRYQNGDSYSDVFQRADDAMYQNKKAMKKKYNLPER